MQFDHLKTIMDRTIEAKEETGASLVLTQHGETIFSYNSGLADVKQKKPFTETTICRAFSCSKVVTSVACMLLMEQGLLDTSWPLSRIIPEFANPCYVRNWKKQPSPEVTIRDLLNMTSGIAYPGDRHEGSEGATEVWNQLDQSIRNGHSMTTMDFAKAMGKVPLMFPAGEEWMYGSSADILGAVIEKLSGMELSEFFDKYIFEPLGMTDTAFYVPSDKRDRLAVLYETAGEQPKKPDYVNLCIYDYEQKPLFQSGGAGLFSTAADFAKLGNALSTIGIMPKSASSAEANTRTKAETGTRPETRTNPEPKPGLLSRHTINFMRENGLTENQRITFNWDSLQGYGYANLVRCLEKPNLAGSFASKGAFGWDGWTGTYLLCDPEEQLSITIFLQRCGAGTTQLSRNIVNAVYSEI